MQKGMVPAAVLAAMAALCGPHGVSAQDRPAIAEAQDITFWEGGSRELIIGVYADVPGRPAEQIGFLVRCVRDSGFLEIGLEFGIFPPPGVAVQGMLRGLDGRLERLAPPENEGPGPAGDIHVVDIDNPRRTRADLLLRMLFRNGTLLTNGYNSVLLKVPEARNRQALDEIGSCVGRKAAGRRGYSSDAA